MAAPSSRALSRLICSSTRKSGSSMGAISKVQDKKKLPEWSLYESVWFGRGWWMSREFEAVRNKYPRIPVEKVDARHHGKLAAPGEYPVKMHCLDWSENFAQVLGERQVPKLFGFLNTNLYSVIVKADLKGKNVTKRTMLVTGRDVKQLEAAVERRNRFRSLSTGLKDLIWNRQQE